MGEEKSIAASCLGSRLGQRRTIATGNLHPQGEALESGEGWDVKKPSPEGGEGGLRSNSDEVEK